MSKSFFSPHVFMQTPNFVNFFPLRIGFFFNFLSKGLKRLACSGEKHLKINMQGMHGLTVKDILTFICKVSPIQLSS